MNFHLGSESFCAQHSLPPPIPSSIGDRGWFAVFTTPQHEKTVVKHLAIREIESFLPTYETIRSWKNRQKVKLVLPLFPTYLFVRIRCAERSRVLQSPGVIRLVGNSRESIPLRDAEIESLRMALATRRVEPFQELVVGTRVRVKCGVMQGVEGTLVRKNDSLRFVLSMQLINQHAAVQVDAADLEPAFH